MNNIEIVINKASLPDSINGCTVFDDDHAYKIYINDTLSPDEQAAAFLHEMLHVWNNDFNSNEAADHIEKNTHEQLKRISDIIKDGWDFTISHKRFTESH